MIKIENPSHLKLPRKTEEIVHSVFNTVPREHIKGLSRIVFVDKLSPDPRLPIPNLDELPGLYHPKLGTTPPWCEVALGRLLPNEGFFKRLAARLTFKANLVSLLFSLQAQHYHLTLSHGLKKHQYENAIRSYMERYHSKWQDNQGGIRARLFRPLRPYLNRWAKRLRKSYQREQKRRSG